jgi:hypothetical protein
MRVIQNLVEWLQPRENGVAPEPLSIALERVRHAVRPGSLIIIISDFFSLDEDCNRHLSRLRQHNDVIGCQILDRAECKLPRGRYPITDGSATSIMDTGQSADHKRFTEMSLQHLEEPRRMFYRHQCGWMVMYTDDDPVDLLGKELRILVGRPV